MGVFQRWVEAKQFTDEDLQALGHGDAVYHYDKKYDWHVYFFNAREDPVAKDKFAELVKKDKKLVQKFFDIVYGLFEVAEEDEARHALRRQTVNQQLAIPIVMIYRNQGTDQGYYRANTPDLPNPRPTSTNYVEINRTPRSRTQSIVRLLTHEFGHAIYHAINSPKLLAVIYRYVRREVNKFDKRDAVAWWGLARGRKVEPPTSNVNTDYGRHDFYSPGYYPTHESGSEWFSEVLADLVINPRLQQPFLRFIRSRLSNMIQFDDAGTVSKRPEYRPTMFPDAPFPGGRAKKDPEGYPTQGHMVNMQRDIRVAKRLADMGAVMFR